MDNTLPEKYKEAISYNSKNGEVAYNINLIWVATELNRCVSPDTKEFIDAVMKFQRKNGLEVDGKIGKQTLSKMERVEMSEDERIIAGIVDKVVVFESAGRADAVSADNEFKGLVNRAWQRKHGKNHPAYQTCHIGLSLGWIQMTQDGGSLGVFLQKCAQKNPQKFKTYVGNTWHELLDVVTSPGKSGYSSRPRKLRGPRVKKVPIEISGQLERRDIWEHPWLGRLQKLASDPEFKQVQREVAYEVYLKPMGDFLKGHNFLSEKFVAVALALSVHRGAGGAKKRIGKFIRGSEQATLKELAKHEKRALDILEDDGISWGVWEGTHLI